MIRAAALLLMAGIAGAALFDAFTLGRFVYEAGWGRAARACLGKAGAIAPPAALQWGPP